MMGHFVLVGFCAVALVACAGGEKLKTLAAGGAAYREYKNLVHKSTRSKEVYVGAEQIFQARVSFLSSQVQGAFSNLGARDEVLVRGLEPADSKSYFFVSFFTPNRRLNAFGGSSPVWRAALRVSGKVYEPLQTQSDKRALGVLQRLFLHPRAFDRFYVVSFDVPSSLLESVGFSFILQSLDKTHELSFKH